MGHPASGAGRAWEPVPGGTVNVVDVVDKTGRVLEVLGRGNGCRHCRWSPACAAQPPGNTFYRPGELAEEKCRSFCWPPRLPLLSWRKQGLNLSFRSTLVLTAAMGGTKALIVLGNSAQIAQKLAVLEELSRRVSLSGYRLVDLTVPQRPALTPLPNSGNRQLGHLITK